MSDFGIKYFNIHNVKDKIPCVLVWLKYKCIQ